MTDTVQWMMPWYPAWQVGAAVAAGAIAYIRHRLTRRVMTAYEQRRQQRRADRGRGS